MTARHRCPGRCGKSLPAWMDVCRACASRDADVMVLTGGALRPTPCEMCGHAIAPARVHCDNATLCTHCEAVTR